MGDDVELYIEMQDPSFWNWVDKYIDYSYGDDDYKAALDIRSPKKKFGSIYRCGKRKQFSC